MNLVFGMTVIGQAAIVPYYAHVRYGVDPVVGGGELIARGAGYGRRDGAQRDADP